jgi:hypothetical protein
MPIGPVHHRRDREAPGAELFVIQDKFPDSQRTNKSRMPRANRGDAGVRSAFSQFAGIKAR